MCGITGIWKFSEQVDHEELKNFNNSLERRGPDYGEVQILHHGSMGLGHRRLSIIDLSESGNQPMKVGPYTLVFNGEIFNYIELKKELETKGYSFRTKTDTEVVIHSIDCWGKEALNKFNGMWAFALWDERTKELFLSRDRFGIKPLYYSSLPGKHFVFSSQTLAFKKLNWISRDYDFDSINLAWNNPYLLEGVGKTIFGNISGLLPGHSIIVSEVKKEIKQERWWFPEKHVVKHHSDYNIQKEEYRELFLDACKIRLRSDVPLASALSGGVDSSAVYSGITHITQNENKKSHKCFIGSFPNTEQDETSFALDAVNYVNGNYELVIPDQIKLIDQIQDITLWYDGLNAIPLTGISVVYEAMRRNNYIISLDGHGPDEMFFGYHDLMQKSCEYAIWNLPKSYALNFIKAYASRYEDSDSVEKGLMKELLKSGSSLKDKLFKLRNKKTLNNGLNGKDIYNSSELSEHQYNFNNLISPLKNTFESFYVTSLPGILKSIDHISMYSSVEVRSPFLDYRLINFTSSLPLKSRVGNGYNKRIIRESQKGIMSPNIINRTTKKGFGSPLHSWVKESKTMQQFLMDNINSQKGRNLPLPKIEFPDFSEMDMRDATELWKRTNLILLKNE